MERIDKNVTHLGSDPHVEELPGCLKLRDTIAYILRDYPKATRDENTGRLVSDDGR